MPSSSSSSSGDALMADAANADTSDKPPFEKPEPKVTSTTLQRFKGHYKAWVSKYVDFVKDELKDPKQIAAARAGYLCINTWMMCVSKSRKLAPEVAGGEKLHLPVAVRRIIFEYFGGGIMKD